MTTTHARDVANSFLEAFSQRDYDRIAATFTEDGRLRGLVPPGLREADGREAIAERFRIWNEDAPFNLLNLGNPNILALDKSSRDGAQRGVLLINKDPQQSQAADLSSLGSILGNLVTLTWPKHRDASTLPPAGYQIFASVETP